MATTWILLRGLIREHAHWYDFPERFSEHLVASANPCHRLLCLDLPGNGDAYRQRSPNRVSAMVDAARQSLSERHIESPVRLVALSLGGMVAMDWLRRFPEQIEGAAMINSSASRFSPFWQRLRPGNYPAMLRHGLFDGDDLAREKMILDITTNLLHETKRQELARCFVAVGRQRPVSAANKVRQLWAAARFRAPQGLPAGPAVLIINGAGDRLVNPDCSRALARAWDRPMAVHPTGGHDLSLDAPDWLADVLVRWWHESRAAAPVQAPAR